AVPRKIGALGVRVERGVAYHGIALNVAVDLADFDLIDPCGMPGLASTSIAAELRRAGSAPVEPPSTGSVGPAAAAFPPALATRLGAVLAGDLPPVADPQAERAALDRLPAPPAPPRPAPA